MCYTTEDAITTRMKCVREIIESQEVRERERDIRVTKIRGEGIPTDAEESLKKSHQQFAFPSSLPLSAHLLPERSLSMR